ncbi:MAG: hypothetical protein HY909_09220 [Deltaproteobacteria bacterium]|nr:hypothetical protein [Deltaproteobacteria bacterium]
MHSPFLHDRRAEGEAMAVLACRDRADSAVVPLLVRLLLGERDQAALVLHEDVRFTQGDGTVLHGRSAVLAVFDGADRGRYRILGGGDDTVRVELSAPGVPGSVTFTLVGRAEGLTLIEVTVRVD